MLLWEAGVIGRYAISPLLNRILAIFYNHLKSAKGLQVQEGHGEREETEALCHDQRGARLRLSLARRERQDRAVHPQSGARLVRGSGWFTRGGPPGCGQRRQRGARDAPPGIHNAINAATNGLGVDDVVPSYPVIQLLLMGCYLKLQNASNYNPQTNRIIWGRKKEDSVQWLCGV